MPILHKNGYDPYVYNILWLKFLIGSVKQHPFYPVKISSVYSNPFWLHGPFNANELSSPHPSPSMG